MGSDEVYHTCSKRDPSRVPKFTVYCLREFASVSGPLVAAGNGTLSTLPVATVPALLAFHRCTVHWNQLKLPMTYPPVSSESENERAFLVDVLGSFPFAAS